jgi:hypothetical protein
MSGVEAGGLNSAIRKLLVARKAVLSFRMLNLTRPEREALGATWISIEAHFVFNGCPNRASRLVAMQPLATCWRPR